MSNALQRGWLLYRNHRYPEAQVEAVRALSAEPQSPHPHMLLAYCLQKQKKSKDALAEARQAISLSPDESLPYYVLGCIINSLVIDGILKPKPFLQSSREAILQAISIEPENPDYLVELARIEFIQERWRESANLARRALAIEPGHTDCLNIHSLCMLKLGNFTEAEHDSSTALAHSAQTSLYHANRADLLLHIGKYDQALEHASEAMRLDPNSETSRSSFVEALKARYLLYRILLRPILWMDRLKRGNRIGILVILFTLGRLCASPEMVWSPSMRVVSLVSLILFLWIIMHRPVFNLTVMSHPRGRYALSSKQKLTATIVGFFVAMFALGALLSLLAVLFYR